ncbi:MAG: anthranilate synthase component I family protein [Pelagibacteraceae bacterium]|nr:anthranilate synthase component I family protein [Pelagibacteraceae bacterium]HJL57893.1 chorismate-binding protein [Alphaproteobacteria bacterium]MBO6467864.1 anthranilate synthase component I family protein [Pelagibacteraceae bacterium]MBO6469880.1 anthranilate synthase component I family protein [Pelagibacteraceae bacterium]MBO6479854.1 anthranilate synthase component I family protein [Pelagibacteraceae bacterium]
MDNKAYLNRLFESDKPLIIYKMNKGFDVYTDFSDKVVIRKSNLKNFIKKTTLSRKKYNKFFNGYIGFFGYELCCELIGVKIPNQQSNNFYKSIFYKPQTVIKIRRNIRIQSILSNFKSLDNLKKSKKKYVYQKKFKVNLSLGQYSKLFDKFIKKIKRGETYQIKICQKYRNNSRIDPVRFFWNLMKINKSPESFVIRDLDYSIVSCSPETLIEKKNNMITTKPIAGTLKRTSRTSKNKAKIYFQNNEKESKEHNMIVDMERNDLSRICKKGSVRISKLKYVEEYKDLYHYVTKVVGKLDGSKKIMDIIKAMLPGGSVIGCPKINTLNLLNRHEKDNRNIYTGSFGYIKSNGDMRFNIMIRAILNFKDVCEISVASGVVWGSTAKKEYHENFIKAKSLLDIFKL